MYEPILPLHFGHSNFPSTSEVSLIQSMVCSIKWEEQITFLNIWLPYISHFDLDSISIITYLVFFSLFVHENDSCPTPGEWCVISLFLNKRVLHFLQANQLSSLTIAYVYGFENFNALPARIFQKIVKKLSEFEIQSFLLGKRKEHFFFLPKNFVHSSWLQLESMTNQIDTSEVITQVTKEDPNTTSKVQTNQENTHRWYHSMI